MFKQMIHEAVTIDKELAGKFGLALTDMVCITFLADTDAPVNAKMLAEHVNLSTGATTALIDRLEREGFVVRRPNPADRRSVIIVLVEDRVNPLLANFEKLRYRLKRAHDGLSQDEVLAVTRFMQNLLADD
ncbi:MarR family transcriptional regulator [Jiella sp. KSK16Y-1]|uniref:MarR family transcriptional regulator n=1 Tax=Jiella mangrovi TaxID=2821407 RepID=A0ABS4BIH2_9HYPH|nr:MarR family transcriptional regulator [Jiella mangrovi]